MSVGRAEHVKSSKMLFPRERIGPPQFPFWLRATMLFWMSVIAVSLETMALHWEGPLGSRKGVIDNRAVIDQQAPEVPDAAFTLPWKEMETKHCAQWSYSSRTLHLN